MFIKLFLLYFLSLNLVWAADCGPMPKAKNNSVWVYEECIDSDSTKDCITLKDRAWTFYNVRRERVMPLEVEKASVKITKKEKVLILTQSKNAGCHFSKTTKKNLKKKLFFVVRGEIVAAPLVNSPMSQKMQIPMGKEWPKTELLAFCQWMLKECVLEELK